MLSNPCIACGTPTDNGTRCKSCETANQRMRLPGGRRRSRASAHARGYNAAWTRLSKRARELQPFCSDCGATTDLQADHSPEAWRRKERGLAIRLRDIDVVCGYCNRKRGAARGKSVSRRSKPLKTLTRTNGTKEI